jgi:hypothetical protein
VTQKYVLNRNVDLKEVFEEKKKTLHGPGDFEVLVGGPPCQVIRQKRVETGVIRERRQGRWEKGGCRGRPQEGGMEKGIMIFKDSLGETSSLRGKEKGGS